ncbi:hypothetical protein B0H13DRAFT_2364277 [Mycena leptocephala]|nr:hypothetical protein B0H13DRAFT_2364277 [Mycena leptocephala]
MPAAVCAMYVQPRTLVLREERGERPPLVLRKERDRKPELRTRVDGADGDTHAAGSRIPSASTGAFLDVGLINLPALRASYSPPSPSASFSTSAPTRRRRRLHVRRYARPRPPITRWPKTTSTSIHGAQDHMRTHAP